VLNEERRRNIVDLLRNNGSVLVTELARRFDTSEVTIRKDLEILDGRGVLHRTHGGALAHHESALSDPMGLHTALAKGLDPDHPRHLSRVVMLDDKKDQPIRR
jgi:DeoR/GlpR family transcriptional regulator of sugar metabolism